MLNGSKILVTGASGSLGSQIVYELHKQKVEAICHVREKSDTRYIDSLNLSKKIADLRNESQLKEIVKGIDYIIHTAAWVDFRMNKVTQFTGINVMGAVNLFKFASEAGVKKFVHVSTVGAVGANVLSDTNSRCTEETVYNLENTKVPYLLTKRHAESELLKLAEQSKTELIIVNPSIIISSKKSGLTGRLYVKKLFSRFFLPEIPNLINIVDVRDVAVGTIAALRKGKPNQRYILGGENITIKNLILMISAILGKSPHLILIPRPLINFAVRMFFLILNFQNKGKSKISLGLLKLLDYNWVYNSRKAHEDLDFRTRSLQSSLRDILQGKFRGTPANPE